MRGLPKKRQQKISRTKNLYRHLTGGSPPNLRQKQNKKPLLDKPVKGVFIMRYSFEFKMKCVELYRKGTWVETPENVKQQSFRRKILNWDKIEKIHGPKGLERVKKTKKLDGRRKIDICFTGFKWESSIRGCFPSGISVGLLGSWVQV